MRKIINKERSGNSKLEVVHPATAEIHSGQLLLIRVPTDLGRPTEIKIGAVREVLPEHAACVHSSSLEGAVTEYVVCMVLLPLDSNFGTKGQLEVAFGGGQRLITSSIFRLLG